MSLNAYMSLFSLDNRTAVNMCLAAEQNLCANTLMVTVKLISGQQRKRSNSQTLKHSHTIKQSKDETLKRSTLKRSNGLGKSRFALLS